MSNQKPLEQKIKVSVCVVRPISVREPYRPGHWEYIHRAIEESLSKGDEKYQFDVKLASENTNSDVIQNTIIGNLYHADVVICDLSSLNPNVFFELGIRMAFQRPCILLIDDNTNAPFDVAPIRYITYPSSLHRYELERVQEEIKTSVIGVYELFKKSNQVAYSPFFTEVKINEKATMKQEEQTSLELLTKKIDSIHNVLLQQDSYYIIEMKRRQREMESLKAKAIEEQRNVEIRNKIRNKLVNILEPDDEE